MFCVDDYVVYSNTGVCKVVAVGTLEGFEEGLIYYTLKPVTRPETVFIPVDEEKFPSLGFARQAIAGGGTLPAVMNAANEIAVERFRRGEVKFTDIWKIVERTMAHHHPEPQESLEQIREADAAARRFAEKLQC